MKVCLDVKIIKNIIKRGGADMTANLERYMSEVFPEPKSGIVSMKRAVEMIGEVSAAMAKAGGGRVVYP